MGLFKNVADNYKRGVTLSEERAGRINFIDRTKYQVLGIFNINDVEEAGGFCYNAHPTLQVLCLTTGNLYIVYQHNGVIVSSNESKVGEYFSNKFDMNEL